MSSGSQGWGQVLGRSCCSSSSFPPRPPSSLWFLSWSPTLIVFVIPPSPCEQGPAAVVVVATPPLPPSRHSVVPPLPPVVVPPSLSFPVPPLSLLSPPAVVGVVVGVDHRVPIVVPLFSCCPLPSGCWSSNVGVGVLGVGCLLRVCVIGGRTPAIHLASRGSQLWWRVLAVGFPLYSLPSCHPSSSSSWLSVVQST